MARPLVIPILGNTSDLEAALTRSGVVAEDASKKIQGSFRAAGLAAADEAKKLGASVDVQAAAAGRAAAAFTEMSAKITTAQRNAGKAAATAAGAVGASVDEQRAAYAKAIAVQSEYEAAVGRAANAAKAAAAEQAAAAEAAAAKVAAAAEKQAAAVESAQKKMASLGKYALGGGIAIAGFSVKGAVDLQRSMEQIHTQAGASQAEVNKLTKAVMNIAPSLATGPEALAGSLFHVVSGGVPAAHALQVMAAAAKEAKISGADLNDTTTALTSTVYSGISGAENYAKAMGMLNATVGAGDMHFQDLNEALGGPMLATVKGYGLSLHDVSAALATMGDLNIRGADAATQLRMAVQYMAKPAATAGPLLEKLGLNTHSFANAMANGGLMPALKLLHDRLDAVGVKGNQMAQVIGDLFTKKGASGIDILENSLGKLGQKYTQTGSTASKQNQAWAATQHTLAFQMDQLKATVQSLGDKFGTYLIPKLEAAGHAVKDVIGWLEKHKTAAHDLAIVIGGVLATAITVFAYTKAVAFVGATKDMIVGMSKVVSFATGGLIPALGRVEAANATAGASFTAVGTKAGVGAAEVESRTAAMAAAVEADDAAMEVSNRALGASFLGLLGPIGLAAGAVAMFGNSLGSTKTVTANAAGMSPAQRVKWFEAHGLDAKDAQAIVAAGPGGKGSGAGVSSSLGLPGNVMSLLNPTAASVSVSLPSKGSTAERIAAALKGQGFNDVTIAGILGNLAQETGGGNLNAITPNATGPNGMGIAQWTAGRRQAEIAYAGQHHESPTSLQAQVGYLVQELRTDFHNVYAAMAAAKTPQQAAAIFDKSPAAGGFEGGTDPGGIREKAAAQAMAMLTSGGGLSNSALNALLDAGKKKPGPKSIRELLYANPFAGDSGVTQGRTDMGVDFTAPAGSRIGAIGSGRITDIIANWFKGQPLVEEQLTSGPDKGKFVYYAEQLNALVKQGQQVRAGQAIGTVAAHGSGLELGFGAGGGRTLAQATTGYREGQVTPAGQAFNKFLQSIGSGRYETVKGGVVTGGQGPSIMATLAQLEQAFTTAITKAGTSLLQKLSNAVQSGTLRSLSAALGENTSHMVTTPGVARTAYGRGYTDYWGTTTSSVATRLHGAIEGLGGNASLGQINRATSGLVAQGSAGSTQEKAYLQDLLNLEQTGQTKLAEKLVAAHKAAMQALGQEIYAAQVAKDAESLQLESQKLTDQTTAITDAAQNQLNVVKAQYQVTNDIGQAQITAIRDMTQTITDQFSGMVQSVEDHTQMMSDAANAAVQGINDQTQTQVDILGERGLFGLNLIAQKLQVQLDQQKTSDDQAIAVAQRNLDQVTASAHQLTSNAQINLDQVTAAQDQVAALAQQRADTIAVNQQIRLAGAQARVDANTLHEDVSLVGPAQIAVDLGATLPKAQQDVLNAQLKKAQGQAGTDEGSMAKWFAGVQGSVNQITAAAQQTATSAQDAANTQIAAAQQTLATVQGEADLAIAAAQGTLAGVQGTAATTEAGLQGGVAVTQARASTQYAGSGATINIYGTNANNAADVGEAVSWAMRTAVSQA